MSKMTNPQIANDEKIAWNAIRTIYKQIATQEAQFIIRLLLPNKKIQSKDLMAKAGLTESQFHPLMRQLVKYSILEKDVDQDRRVFYSISLFGKNVMNINEKLLEEVKENLSEKLLAS